MKQNLRKKLESAISLLEAVADKLPLDDENHDRRTLLRIIQELDEMTED